MIRIFNKYLSGHVTGVMGLETVTLGELIIEN